MSIEAALTSWLEGDPDVRDLAGNRIYPQKIPQGAQLPAVTYFKTTHDTTRSLGGLSGLSTTRFQVDCWSARYGNAKKLAIAIRGDATTPKLDGFRGTLAGVFVQACFCRAETDLFSPPVHGDDLGMEHVALEFEITYEDVETIATDGEQPIEDS